MKRAHHVLLFILKKEQVFFSRYFAKNQTMNNSYDETWLAFWTLGYEQHGTNSPPRTVPCVESYQNRLSWQLSTQRALTLAFGTHRPTLTKCTKVTRSSFSYIDGNKFMDAMMTHNSAEQWIPVIISNRRRTWRH